MPVPDDARFFAELMGRLMNGGHFILIYGAFPSDRMVSNVEKEQLISALRQAADELEGGRIKTTEYDIGERPN